MGSALPWMLLPVAAMCQFGIAYYVLHEARRPHDPVVPATPALDALPVSVSPEPVGEYIPFHPARKV